MILHLAAFLLSGLCAVFAAKRARDHLFAGNVLMACSMLTGAGLFASASLAFLVGATSGRAEAAFDATMRSPAEQANYQRLASLPQGHVRQPVHARAPRARSGGASKAGQVVGGRPRGCPMRFCGCGASLKLFGRIIPSLNLAANWIREFPRTSPAPNMAAARPGHVMVLLEHVSGDQWLVHDSNSGGGRTRIHVRSIRGFVVVNPHVRVAGG